MAARDDLSFTLNSIEEAKDIFEYSYCLFVSSNTIQAHSSSLNPDASIEVIIMNNCNTYSCRKISARPTKFRIGKGPVVDYQGKHYGSCTAAACAQHIYIYFQLDHFGPDYLPNWDDLESKMRQMIALGEKIVSCISSGVHSQKQSTSYCLDMGYIIPLYTVATRCPEPAIR
jgi:hypothetical protein